MAAPRSTLARTALAANEMAWLGLSLLLLGIAGEQTAAAFSGSWTRALGWAMLLAVAAALAVVGVVEQRSIGAGKTPWPRPQR